MLLIAEKPPPAGSTKLLRRQNTIIDFLLLSKTNSMGYPQTNTTFIRTNFRNLHKLVTNMFITTFKRQQRGRRRARPAEFCYLLARQRRERAAAAAAAARRQSKVPRANRRNDAGRAGYSYTDSNSSLWAVEEGRSVRIDIAYWNFKIFLCKSKESVRNHIAY